MSFYCCRIIHDKFPKVALKYSKSELVSYNFVILFDKLNCDRKIYVVLKYIMHCDVIKYDICISFEAKFLTKEAR